LRSEPCYTALINWDFGIEYTDHCLCFRTTNCVGLWRRYINIALTTLDIIHRPVFYLEHAVSETEAETVPVCWA
jgi:hypothetical protein